MRFPVDFAGEGLYGISWGKKVFPQQIRRDRISEICDCRGEKLEALDNCPPLNGPMLRGIGIFDNSDCVRDILLLRRCTAALYLCLDLRPYLDHAFARGRWAGVISTLLHSTVRDIREIRLVFHRLAVAYHCRYSSLLSLCPSYYALLPCHVTEDWHGWTEKWPPQTPPD